MLKFNFNKDKAVNSILYITHRMGQCDILKVFKILYFADRMHLVRFGWPILGDTYIAMKDGPVPSRVYDIIKIVRGDSIYIDDSLFNFFEVLPDKYTIISKINANVDYFSESELECLDLSIEENHRLSYSQLSKKSHDIAWERAERNTDIKIEDMAQAGGANKEVIEYIKLIAENEECRL